MRSPKPLRFRGLPSRTWSIRAKIISLLLVPLVTLVAMWGLATYVTLGPGLDLVRAQSNLAALAQPADNLRTELQVERKLSVAYLAATRRDPAALAAQRTKTNTALEAFRTAATGASDASDLTAARSSDVVTRLESMSRLRSTVDRAEVDRLGALRQFTELIAAVDLVYESVLVSPDPEIAEQAHAVVMLGRARELMSQADALVSGALSAGTLSATELGQTIQLIGAQRNLLTTTGPDLEEDDRDAFAAVMSGEAVVRLTTLENSIITNGRAGSPPPIDAGSWDSANHDVSVALQVFEARAANSLATRISPAATLIFTRIGIAGLLGLITVLITILATVRIGRDLLKRLAGLRQAALEMAIDRLPRVVRRLRHGETVDVAHEAPPLPYGDDEIGQVGRAFNELQRTAVNAAVDEANLRRGLNEVFLNIARRSQTLLHRQLSILDRMERRTNDPTELEDLFRVDHLATRMRRHAEDLVILAGAAPGRGWRNPVPLVDVLRGAVSEVEDYARVTVRPLPDVAIAGRAVGDVIHLLAELVENATSFSPPHTKVNIGGEPVSHGFAVEIEDRGLGLTPAALAEVNFRLSDPPDFDPTNSAQLGLFVVARLAARHGVKVQLRSSAYGGITAVALLPDDLVVPRSATIALPAGPTRGELDELEDFDDFDEEARPAAVVENRGTTYASGAYRASVGYEAPDDDDAPVTPARPYSGNSNNGMVTEAAVLVEEVVEHGAEEVVEETVPAAPPKPRHSRREVIEAPGGDGLPKRVRQTSLAPQLRDAPLPNDPSPASTTSRSPEELRAMMTSFQSGTNRGRQDADSIIDDVTDGQAERDAL